MSMPMSSDTEREQIQEGVWVKCATNGVVHMFFRGFTLHQWPALGCLCFQPWEGTNSRAEMVDLEDRIIRAGLTEHLTIFAERDTSTTNHTPCSLSDVGYRHSSYCLETPTLDSFNAIVDGLAAEVTQLAPPQEGRWR